MKHSTSQQPEIRWFQRASLETEQAACWSVKLSCASCTLSPGGLSWSFHLSLFPLECVWGSFCALWPNACLNPIGAFLFLVLGFLRGRVFISTICVRHLLCVEEGRILLSWLDPEDFLKTCTIITLWDGSRGHQLMVRSGSYPVWSQWLVT